VRGIRERCEKKGRLFFVENPGIQRPREKGKGYRLLVWHFVVNKGGRIRTW